MKTMANSDSFLIINPLTARNTMKAQRTQRKKKRSRYETDYE